MNLQKETKVFGLIAKVSLLTLLVLITCTCSGPRLMLGNQTFEKQIDYSTFSGKLAKQTNVVMECAILKTVDRDFLLWPVEKQLIWLQLVPMHDSAYCPNLGPTPRKCSQIKSYQYRSIIRSFLNPYRTVWTVPKPSWHTGFPHQSSQDGTSLVQVIGPRSSRDSIQRSIGRTPVITPMMERNSNSSSTMNQASGRGRTTSSTTGGSRKRH